MKRKIIKIDADKCNGCELCVKACHEGAIGMKDGKAVLLRDDYCDGMGDCLPACPAGAISFEEREALPYNEEEVKRNMQDKKHFIGCPGMMAKVIARDESPNPQTPSPSISRLNQWPVQIKLVPVNAPYFNGAHLLVAADCSAYAYGNFHNEFMKNKITVIGCPKLDSADYAEKLTAILAYNDEKSVTVSRMEVPCCGGIEHAVKSALTDCGKMIPWRVVTISTDGQILDGF